MKIRNQVWNVDVRDGLVKLPEESIDCCITSPPYWNLRDYGVEGQIGLESTFKEYVDTLCSIFDLLKPKLKKSGTLFVNLGDTYGSGKGDDSKYNNGVMKNKPGVKGYQKCLLLIPQRFAIEMVNRGWILRNVIIWHKPNCMPSSARDRFTVDFEYVYFFVKSKRYYFDQDAVRELLVQNVEKHVKQIMLDKDKNRTHKENSMASYYKNTKSEQEIREKLQKGRNKRCVWKIPTKPNSEAHFATFPPNLIKPMIKAGCPKDGIVLDPFLGSGTTALTAWKLGRDYLGFELSKEYMEIIEKTLKKTKFKRLDAFC